MKAEINNIQGYHVIQLTGEVELHNSPHCRDIILDCLGKGHNIVLDLSAVTYLDSSGIASFVEGYKYAKEHNLEFGLMNVNDVVRRMLELARLDEVFPIYDSLK